MHIPQVLRQLCIFPRSFTWTPGLFFLGFPHIPGTCTALLHVFDSWKFICAHPADAPAILNFFWVIYTDTRVFFSAVPHIPETCTAFLHVCDSWEFICAHPADAPEILHFSRTFYPDTRVVFFRFFALPQDMYYICTC